MVLSLLYVLNGESSESCLAISSLLKCDADAHWRHPGCTFVTLPKFDRLIKYAAISNPIWLAPHFPGIARHDPVDVNAPFTHFITVGLNSRLLMPIFIYLSREGHNVAAKFCRLFTSQCPTSLQKQWTSAKHSV